MKLGTKYLHIINFQMILKNCQTARYFADGSKKSAKVSKKPHFTKMDITFVPQRLF